jgi:protein O-mannosyl-transferase
MSPQFPKAYRFLAVCCALLLAVVVVFGRTAGHDFVNYDDPEYVYQNPHVQAGVTGDATAWALTTFYAHNWHPLTWLSHMLDCQIFGLQSGGHHLTNVFLHAAAAMLLFLALERMTTAFWPSAWVAAVFAIHPLRVESVAWVAERKDVLSGLFFMLTLWFYARYAERPSLGRYLLVLASFALGLTAKPMLVTLPFVLLLLDYWPLRRLAPPRLESQTDDATPRRTLARLVLEKIPFFVLTAASCTVTLAAQRGAIVPLDQRDVSWRLANAALACVGYLEKMVYPSDLAVLYPLPKDLPPAWEVAAAVTALLAISTALVVSRRRRPYLFVGWFWYLGMLAPVIGLVQVGSQKMADRYTYLPQVGLYIAVAWTAVQMAGARPNRRRALAAVALLVVMGLLGCALQQTRHWRNSETLWTHTLACTSQNVVAHHNLGNALAREGHFGKAIVQYQLALEINPDLAKVHYNLGLALAARKHFDEAIAHYRKALEIQPEFAEAYNDIGNAFVDLGQPDEAIAHYRQALAIKSDLLPAHYNLGLALAGRDRLDEALEHYRKALDLAFARNDRLAAETIQAQINKLDK